MEALWDNSRIAAEFLCFGLPGVCRFTVKNSALIKMGVLSGNKNCISIRKFPVSLTCVCFLET